MRVLNWVLKLVFHNLGWKLLSVAIAIVVWVLVANEPELLTQVRVGVWYTNLPGYLEVNADLVSSVSLELSGPSGELRGLVDNGFRPQVILDWSKVRPGTNTFTTGDGNVKLPHGVRFMRADPAKVTVTLSKKKSG
jgi:hypothetical protein